MILSRGFIFPDYDLLLPLVINQKAHPHASLFYTTKCVAACPSYLSSFNGFLNSATHVPFSVYLKMLRFMSRRGGISYLRGKGIGYVSGSHSFAPYQCSSIFNSSAILLCLESLDTPHGQID